MCHRMFSIHGPYISCLTWGSMLICFFSELKECRFEWYSSCLFLACSVQLHFPLSARFDLMRLGRLSVLSHLTWTSRIPVQWWISLAEITVLYCVGSNLTPLALTEYMPVWPNWESLCLFNARDNGFGFCQGIKFQMCYSKAYCIFFAVKEFFFLKLKLPYSETLKNHYKQVIPPTHP